MKFAFSTASCPEWDFETAAVRAGEMRYQGVEIHGSFRETNQSASNLFLTDLNKLARLFADRGVEIACVAGSAGVTGNKTSDAQTADECRRLIDTAAALDCGLVKIPDGAIRAGQSRAAAGQALGDWLEPLGDYAARRNVSLVVENALGERSAREIWAILDRISHPSVGCCWNILNATLIGESPFISVPTLNNRIEYASVADARINSTNIDYSKLGEGDVPVEKFLSRLRGIGYEGWVTVGLGGASNSDTTNAEAILSDAIHKLTDWSLRKNESPAVVKK